ncbi:MAG: YiiX/YebB-like N1pC/P60 family cysteine hydrolase [Planctomycetota bacterium]|jgi:hypothetical protein
MNEGGRIEEAGALEGAQEGASPRNTWRVLTNLVFLLAVVLIANNHFYGIVEHPWYDIHSDDVLFVERAMVRPAVVPVERGTSLSELAEIPARGAEPAYVRPYWHGIDHPALHRWVFHFLLRLTGRMPEQLPEADWDYSKSRDWNVAEGRIAPAGARWLMRVTNAALMVAAAVFIYLAAARRLDPLAGFVCAVCFVDPLNVLGHTIEIVWSLGPDPLLWAVMTAALVVWAYRGGTLSGTICVAVLSGLAASTKLNGAYLVIAFCAWLFLRKKWRLALLAGGVSFVVFVAVNPVIWSRGVFGAPRVLYDFVAWGRLRAGLYARSFDELEGKSWFGARAVILGRFWWLWLAGAVALLAAPRLRRLGIIPFWAAFVSLGHLLTVPAPAPRYVFPIQAGLLIGLVGAYWPKWADLTALAARGRRGVPTAVIWAVVFAVCLSGCRATAPRDPAAIVAFAGIREGDIVFQSLSGPVPEMIEGSTKSPYSHCGLVVRRADGALDVLESLGFVRFTPIEQWIAGGYRGRIAVYRLRKEHRAVIPDFIAACRKYIGRPYDLRYDFDDEQIYCSELLYKGFRDATGRTLGRTVRISDLNWRPYKDLMETLEGGPVPLERELITPRDLARADQLILIYSTFKSDRGWTKTRRKKKDTGQ